MSDHSGVNESIKQRIRDNIKNREDNVLPYWKRTVEGLEFDGFTLKWSPYIPIVPTAKQLAAFMLDGYKEVFFGGSAGGGKALDVRTPIPTPSGWTTMGALKAGDQVFDELGNVCRVVRATGVQHNRKCYRLRFSDGSTMIADADHRWITMTSKERDQLLRRSEAFRSKRRATRPSRSNGTRPHVIELNKNREYAYLPPPTGQVRTTQEIHDTITIRGGSRVNHSIQNCRALNLPVVELPIDPYVLGVWLGDGTSLVGAFTTADKSIARELTQRGYKTKKWKTKYGYGIKGLTTKLRQCGLIQNKHIPAIYLRASETQRLDLLRGLMDTDGTSDKKGNCDFCSTNRRLAEGFAELLHTLGVTGTIQVGRAKLYGKDCGPKYVVCFTPPFIAFNLPRKANRQRLASRPTTRQRYIVSVKPVKSVPVKCIQVDSPSHCYLAGEMMIPTHNTAWLAASALQWVDHPDYSAILFRRSIADASRSGGVLDLVGEWLQPFMDKEQVSPDYLVKWDNTANAYVFPSGATVAFGYLDTQFDYEHFFAGPKYNFIAFDEANQFPEQWVTMSYTRLRKPKGSPIPGRLRLASNPGGQGGRWIKERYKVEFDPERKIYRGYDTDRIFVPAFCWDNPHLDIDDYVDSLIRLDPVTREQMLMGDWGISENGRIKSTWFNKRYMRRGTYLTLDSEFKSQPYNVHELRFFMIVDPAASQREGPGDAQTYKNKEPSWTVISTWFYIPGANALGLWWINRFQKEIPEVCRAIHDDYKDFLSRENIRPEFIGIEWNGLNKGVYQLAERMGLPTRPLDPGAVDKLVRSTEFANRADRGNVYLPHFSCVQAGNWLSKYETELFTWTGHPGQAADQVDVSSYAAIVVSNEFSSPELTQGAGSMPGFAASGFAKRWDNCLT